MSINVARTNKRKTKPYGDNIQVLVQELSSPNPDLKIVKSKTEALGIPYNSDLIVLMSEVLLFLSQEKVSAPQVRV